ncbi:alpha/beta fold hydrolase [Pelagibacterium lentulum]|uniref:Proline iminopeptidase n=1 Tax=Pelagibacterium lentulum TaxID=2029865 RepID=A0A916RKV9_9HYPH|nr:alpha/beta hydrolase [Pelagibacterium lentulum]GGA59166.1 proline iminopeptidase [Pelagibacterium lentulum]
MIIVASIALLVGTATLFVALSDSYAARVTKAMILRPIAQHYNAQTLRMTAPDGIVEEQFVEIGGIEHWMTIRGENRSNPVLVFLHGGPGSGHTMFNPLTQPWERYFTIVQYDQRGASKTFRRNGAQLQSGELSFAQLELDALEAVEYVRARLGADKVILVASSVGSIVGLSLARNHPELFHAYVGTDQNVGGDAFGESWRITLDWLTQYGPDKGVRALEEMGSNPAQWSLAQYAALNHWTIEANPKIPDMVMDVVFPALMTSPSHTMADIQDVQSAMEASMGQLYPELVAFDAYALGTEFDIPFFILQGDTDGITPTTSAKAYFEAVNAPHKEFVTIGQAGHLAAFTRPDQFLDELVSRVRPFAIK